MLNSLIQKKKLILIVSFAILLVFWVLALIFYKGEDKTAILVWTPIMPPVVYGFGRLMFTVTRITAPLKFIKFGIYFFLIFDVIGLVMSVVSLITDFSNGFSPVSFCPLGMIVAMLDEAKKNADIESKQ